jgi:6-phosphogluconolactonase
MRGHIIAALSATAYAIDKKDGKLTKLKEYPMGENPNWVEIVKP